MKLRSSEFAEFGVGIDTARYGHHVSFLNAQKRTAAPAFHFTETPDGYRKLQAALAKLAKKHRQVHFHIRVDAAGQYAENLLQWLQQLDFPATVSVGQPARNRAYRNAHYDKRKADPVESLACARFAIVERPPATPHNPPEFRQLRDMVALLESSSKQITRLVNQLHAVLARTFPELAVEVHDLSCKWVLTLLEKYPTPEKLARAKVESLLKIPHLTKEMAETLQAAAAESLGSNRGDLAEELVRQKVKALRQEKFQHAKLLKLVEQAWDRLPPGPHRRILTIKGIGVQTAAALVAKIVSMERFPTASALVGYFGVFPEEVDVSGTDRHGNPKRGKTVRMCRKGNDLVRRLLYTAAQVAVRHNPAVKELYARLRARGKAHSTCMGHCMAKLLRQVFALWKKDCDFDPEFETKCQTAGEPQSQETEKEVVGHRKAVEPQEVVTTTTATLASKSQRDNPRPPLNFAVLREQVSIKQILEQLQWRPSTTRVGQWRGVCPLHDAPGADSRSFAVNIDKNVYCCHRCGSEGNALDLWAAVHGEPIFEAAWHLVDSFRIDPPLLE